MYAYPDGITVLHLTLTYKTRRLDLSVGVAYHRLCLALTPAPEAFVSYTTLIQTNSIHTVL